MARIGQLFVELSLKANNFTVGLKQAQKDAKELEKSIKPLKDTLSDIGKPMVAVGGAVSAAFIAMSKQAANYGDAIRDASIRTGVSTQALSGLKLAAEQTGTSFESVNTGLIRMSRNAFSAAQGSKESAKAFQSIGVAVKDASGQLRPMESILADVADRFSKMKDGTEKAALAQQMFGRGGAAMIEFLNQGKAGLAAFQKQAEELGLVIGKDAAAAADNFNDSLNLLKFAQLGLANTIGNVLLPSLTKMVNITVGLIVEFRKFAAAHPELIRLVAALAAVIAGSGGLLLGLTALLVILPKLGAALTLMTGPIGIATVAVLSFASAMLAFPKFRGVVADTLKNVIGLFALLGSQIGSIARALMQVAKGQFLAAWDTMSKAANQSLDAMTSAVDAFDTTVSSIEQTIDGLSFKMPDFAQAADGAADFTMSLAGSAGALARLAHHLRGIESEFDAPISRFKLDLKVIGQQVDILTPKLQAMVGPLLSDLEMLDVALKSNTTFTQKAAQQEAAIFEARQKDLEKYEQALRQATESVKRSAGEIFDAMFIKGENVFASLKNLLKGGALSLGRSIFEDITGALLGPVKLAFDNFFTGLLKSTGITKLVSGLGEKLGGLLPGFGGGGASAVSSVAGKATSAVGTIGGTVGSMAGSVVGGVVAGVGGVIGPIIGALMTKGNLKRTEENSRETRDWLELQTTAWNPLFHEQTSWLKWIADQTTILGQHLLPAIEAWGSNIVNAIQRTSGPPITLPAATVADIPKLGLGGFLAKGGLAFLHRGETVLPAGSEMQDKKERSLVSKLFGDTLAAKFFGDTSKAIATIAQKTMTPIVSNLQRNASSADKEPAPVTITVNYAPTIQQNFDMKTAITPLQVRHEIMPEALLDLELGLHGHGEKLAQIIRDRLNGLTGTAVPVGI